MKIWVDDVRPAPDGYVHVKSVHQAIALIEQTERTKETIDLIDLDHDAGEYAADGGDYIRILDWLEAMDKHYTLRIHSMNPVGVENMRKIIRRNGWQEKKL